MKSNVFWENGRGLPRSFADDPFFQQRRGSPGADFFAGFPQAGPTRRFGSNPRLFGGEPGERFFDDFDAPDFGSLPRRPASRSPRPPAAAAPPLPRQPSPRNAEAIPAPAPPPKAEPKVHVINVHPAGAKPEGIVEINQAPSGYTNGKLNPDRQQQEQQEQQQPQHQPQQQPQPPVESVPAAEAGPQPESTPQVAAEPAEPGADTPDMQKKEDQRPKLVRNASINGCQDKLISLLDETELRVEKLRETASQLEQEKEALLDMINNLKLNTEILGLTEGDRDDINATTERILKRCRAVDVVVNTPRNEEQTRALEEVNGLISGVVDKMAENLLSVKDTIERFLNACSPDEPNGPIDQRFQAKIVECTADDQKKIRRRLAQMITQIDRAERTCLPQY